MHQKACFLGDFLKIEFELKPEIVDLLNWRNTLSFTVASQEGLRVLFISVGSFLHAVLLFEGERMIGRWEREGGSICDFSIIIIIISH